MSLRTLLLCAATFAAGILLGLPNGHSRYSPAWKKAALCVHRYEGAWNTNTGNGYYGGFQMDEDFARTYGGWIVAHHGLPHRWRPRTQLLVAYRGYLKRGWQPWPNTARRCGLLS